MKHRGITMKTLLAILFIVSATIKAGNCAVCVECSNSTSSDCVGDLVTCGTCMTKVTEQKSTDGNSTSYLVEKMCQLTDNISNGTHSVKTGQVENRITVNCCNTNYCNEKALEVTPWNKTENGLKCPTCHESDVEKCVANTTVSCTGDETQCLVFSGKIFQKGICQTVAFQGCASELMCNQPGLLNPNYEQCQNSTISCSNAMKTTTYTL